MLKKLNLFWLFVSFGFCLLLSSCANIVSLSGGPADQTAPIVTKESPPNGCVSFTEKEIVICFDEFISIQEAEKNVTISPPLKKKPLVSVSGKCIRVTLDKSETLKPNTTYSINFGGAISDINEANRIFDYSYAFSTGPNIDSLFVGGVVQSALTKQKLPGFTIGLYESICDSCIEKQPPLFFGRSIEGGFFKIKRVKRGEYFVAGFKDENSNGLADKGELIAFTSEPLVVSDSNVSLNLFAYSSPLYTPNSIIDTLTPYNNVCALVFYRNTFRPIVKTIYNYRWSDRSDFDTLYLFSFGSSGFNQEVQLEYPDKKITVPGISNTENKSSVLFTRSITREDTIFIFSSCPIMSFSFDSIRLTKDTSVVPFYAFKHDSFCLRITPKKKLSPGAYQLSLGLGAVLDLYNRPNAKEVIPLVIGKPEDFGSIGLKVNNPSRAHIILFLVDDKDQPVRKISLSDSREIRISNILPGSYRIKIVYDLNKNGEWDYGNINRLIQPEKVVYLSTVFLVRPDWDLDNNTIDIEKIK